MIAFLTLIDGFLRTESKLSQIHQNMNDLLHCNYQKDPDTSNLLKSWWLAGFTEAEGCFYVQIINPRQNRTNHEIRLHFKFGLKDNTILLQFKQTLML